MWINFLTNKLLWFQNELINPCGMPLYQTDLFVQIPAIFLIESLRNYKFILKWKLT